MRSAWVDKTDVCGWVNIEVEKQRSNVVLKVTLGYRKRGALEHLAWIYQSKQTLIKVEMM